MAACQPVLDGHRCIPQGQLGDALEELEAWSGALWADFVQFCWYTPQSHVIHRSSMLRAAVVGLMQVEELQVRKPWASRVCICR